MHNLNNKININIIKFNNKISMLVNLFFIKIKLIAYNINFNNLINHIINIIIVKYYFFMIDKMIIKRFKKYINYIKMNMLIAKDIHFFL